MSDDNKCPYCNGLLKYDHDMTRHDWFDCMECGRDYDVYELEQIEDILECISCNSMMVFDCLNEEEEAVYKCRLCSRRALLLENKLECWEEVIR